MVTINDVAREAGVSKATVSYVLSGNPLISEKTAVKVRGAMKRLGYSVNHAARSLSTARTNTIGIVTPARYGGFFSLSVGAYLYALSAAARKYGYDTLLLACDENADELLTAAQTRKIDGVVVLDVRNKDSRIETLVKTGLPGVLLGVPKDSRGIDCVDTDFDDAAKRLVNMLADAGHEEIIMVGWPQAVYDQGLNYATRFRDAALRAGKQRSVNLRVVCSDDELLGSDQAIKQALGTFLDATAMIIHNDAALVSAQQVLHEIDVSVPEDLSVVSVVPDQMAIGMRIPYTSMSIDLSKVAEETVSVLDCRIKKRTMKEKTVLVPAVLMDAGSIQASEGANMMTVSLPLS